MRTIVTAAIALCSCGIAFAAGPDLQIYFVDVEGGAATLIVTPSRESMLVDAGNPSPQDRLAKQIFQTVQAAHLTKINYLLTTHYDGDHVGGAPALASMIPIEHFLDHGDFTFPDKANVWAAYKSISEGKRTTVKAGDMVPLKGVRVQAVSSNGEVIDKPINHGKANSFCAGALNKEPDQSENILSLGVLLTYGKFKFLDLGDLTWSKEMELACPVNKLGEVSIYQAAHHGFLQDRSGAPAHLFAIRPQVVIVENGPQKGLTTPELYERLTRIPDIEGIWQLHLTLDRDAEHNTNEEMIANLAATHESAYGIRVDVRSNGEFTVTNSRNGFSKSYKAR
jgi:beta-lactamase superfamily II metal-dependent hydrolase